MFAILNTRRIFKNNINIGNVTVKNEHYDDDDIIIVIIVINRKHYENERQ